MAKASGTASVKKPSPLQKKSISSSTETVDGYLKALPKEMKSTLEDVRKAILSASPKIEEMISYRIPTYKYWGSLVHFAAFKDHCSLVVVSKSIFKIFEKELESYKKNGMTIHFGPEKPLPATLVKKIVKTRIKENEELAMIKEAQKSRGTVTKKTPTTAKNKP
jgi:uncharacterized protein YdhG (YjbR/CyaY superfamily)